MVHYNTDFCFSQPSALYARANLITFNYSIKLFTVSNKHVAYGIPKNSFIPAKYLPAVFTFKFMYDIIIVKVFWSSNECSL